MTSVNGRTSRNGMTDYVMGSLHRVGIVRRVGRVGKLLPGVMGRSGVTSAKGEKC